MPGLTIDQVLAKVNDGDLVNVAMTSNQDNGIAGYAEGALRFHKATGGLKLGDPFHPARLESDPGQPLKYFISDRLLDIDPPTPPFGHNPRQPFSANATEQMGMSISTGSPHTMQVSLFGNKVNVPLSPMSDMLVGVGFTLGGAAAGGVLVVSFPGIAPPPPH